MICDVCRLGLENVWDRSKVKAVCTLAEWKELGQNMTGAYWNDTQGFIYGHHVTRESLFRSRDEGCTICTAFQLRDIIDNPITANFGYYSVFAVKVYDAATHKLPLLSVWIGKIRLGTYLDPFDENDPDLNFSLEEYTGDDLTWSYIKSWNDRCLREHAPCIEAQPAQYIPERLLRLSWNTDKSISFQVVSRDQVSDDCPYLTLSHCWDPSLDLSQTMLTTASVTTLSEKQPLEVLPKLYQDLGIIARRLDINHIWVDRFCIVHDGTVGWRHKEAAKIQQIYGNGYLNICATGSSCDDDGLFFNRDISRIVPTIISFSFDGSGQTERYRVWHEKQWAQEPPPFREHLAWHLALDSQPMIKEAWSTQERIFAPRSVHFGRRQIFWECTEVNCCEVHPRTVDTFDQTNTNRPNYVVKPLSYRPYRLKRIMRPDWRDVFDRPILDDVAQNPPLQLMYDWYSLLKYNLGLKISTPHDKLAVFSAIAMDIQQRLAQLNVETEYLAGIWKYQLPQALCWSVLGACSRSKSYSGPSWSWAALDGEISVLDRNVLGDEYDFPLSTVVSASVTPVIEGDITGDVVDGIITLSGPLFAATLIEKKMVEFFKHPVTSDTIFEVPVLGQQPQTREEARTAYDWPSALIPPNIALKSSPPYRMPLDISFDIIEEATDSVFCLPLRWTKYPGPRASFLSGIALLPAGENRYKRVGYWSTEQVPMDLAEVVLDKSLFTNVSII